ncbi:MAG: hypothetical protein L6Q33_09960 [Bacteriovoracaceae bacterium]|nr:hypothetical protein [Bacteriovoracaceae bacterium]
MSFHRQTKGNELEKEASLFYHSKYTPVLVSSLVLRKRGGGQIDLTYLHKDTLTIIELKNGGILSPVQYFRLKDSGSLLGEVLNRTVFLKLNFAKFEKLH